MTDTNTGVVVDQLPLTVAQAPSFCRLCNVQLLGLQTWRAHVKSDGHVYKLRLKVAEPGSVLSPSPPSPRSTNSREKSATPSRIQTTDGPNVGASQDQNVDSDTDDEPSAPEFGPGKCLFCVQEAVALDDNMTHMAAAHGFSVPFQDCLAVDLETVVWYLHLVIYGYRECICCGTRRSTVEGAQHHMVAKGHCRFDISPDTEEFYAMPQSKNVVVEQTQRDASVPVRLPSGKLISHRKHLDAHEPRSARRSTSAPDRELDPAALRLKTSSNTCLTVAQRRGGSGGGEIVRSSEALLAAQLSRLRVADDRAQLKVEKRKRGRLERTNNSILFKHYRLDAGDSRIGRQF